MYGIKLLLDRAVFSEEVMVRTLHRYSGRYFVELHSGIDDWEVMLTDKQAGSIDSEVAAQFKNDALDERLRDSIRTLTIGVAELLLTTALTHAAGTHEPLP